MGADDNGDKEKPDAASSDDSDLLVVSVVQGKKDKKEKKKDKKDKKEKKDKKDKKDKSRREEGTAADDANKDPATKLARKSHDADTSAASATISSSQVGPNDKQFEVVDIEDIPDEGPSVSTKQKGKGKGKKKGKSKAASGLMGSKVKPAQPSKYDKIQAMLDQAHQSSEKEFENYREAKVQEEIDAAVRASQRAQEEIDAAEEAERERIEEAKRQILAAEAEKNRKQQEVKERAAQRKAKEVEEERKKEEVIRIQEAMKAKQKADEQREEVQRVAAAASAAETAPTPEPEVEKKPSIDKDEALIQSIAAASGATTDIELENIAASLGMRKAKRKEKFASFANETGQARKRDASSDDSESDSENEIKKAFLRRIDWENGPDELRPKEEVVAKDPRPGAFVDHVVRYMIKAWKKELDKPNPFENASTAGGMSLDQCKNRQSLALVETDCAPLINQIKEKTLPATMAEQLDEIITCTVAREYMDAGSAYTIMTMGKKKWNNCHANYAGTHCQNKGVRVYHTHQSALLEYDKSPLVQKYCQSIRKIVLFAQALWPNEDFSRALRI